MFLPFGKYPLQKTESALLSNTLELIAEKGVK
jgi:hypothetical protein